MLCPFLGMALQDNVDKSRFREQEKTGRSRFTQSGETTIERLVIEDREKNYLWLQGTGQEGNENETQVGYRGELSNDEIKHKNFPMMRLSARTDYLDRLWNLFPWKLLRVGQTSAVFT